MEIIEKEEILIIETGSHLIKYGAADSTYPYDYARIDDLIKMLVRDKKHAGRKPYRSQGMLHTLTKPKLYVDSLIFDFELLFDIWHEVFYSKLRKDPEENFVLIVEPVLNPKFAREKMAENIFEQLKMRGLYFVSSGVLGLISYGRLSGVVVDIGHNFHSSVCIYEGHCLPHTAFTENLGGHDIEEYLITLLPEVVNYRTDNSSEGAPVLESIKHSFSHAALEPTRVDRKVSKYQILEFGSIDIRNEAIIATEVLFSPTIWHKTREKKPLQETLLESLSACSEDIKSMMLESIYLVGGSSTITGIERRIEAEVVASLPLGEKVVVDTDRALNMKIFYGGYIFAQNFMPLTQEAYLRDGPSVVHQFAA